MAEDKEKLVLIDGHAMAYQAFFALPQDISTSQGQMTNAVYGFTRMLLKILKEEKPDYIAVAFDKGGRPTFRHDKFADYKAHRDRMPAEMRDQLPLIQDILSALKIPIYEMEEYEADDILGTLAKQAEKKGIETIIATPDKDALQLVSPLIKVLTNRRRIGETFTYDEKAIEERYGIKPKQMVDLISLTGDTSDNIPGVPGIGDKTAGSLLQKFGDLENLLSNINLVPGAKRRQNLREYSDRAIENRELVTLLIDLPLELALDKCRLTPFDKEEVISLFSRLEFASLLDILSIDAGEKGNYISITSEEDFQRLKEKLESSSGFTVDTEATSSDPMQAELVGISCAVKPGEANYIPLGHRYLGAPKQLDMDFVLSELKPILEDENKPKWGQNIKYDLILLKRYGLEAKGIEFDTMIASYLLNPSKTRHNLENIALEYLEYNKLTYKEVVGKGAKAFSFDMIDVKRATEYSGEDADITLRLKSILEERLRRAELFGLFQDVEIPLIPILVAMEMWGVKIDVEYLHKMSSELKREMQGLEKEIYELAGGEFNINSPKQLSDIIFEKLKLPKQRRTKTGYSTGSDVLESLIAQGIDDPKLADRIVILPKILEMRQLTKLKNTYIDALPKLINPKTGRIHTSFNQTVTSTGRLSSSDPNLQNIPIRSELGQEIRRAFIPAEGCKLMSADYSQIELRILAHISGDASLISAFHRGEDIHTHTAMEIFGVSPEEVNPLMRRMAKIVNFGVIYGMSPYGLAKRLMIGVAQASKYIENYFARYGGVRDYIETIKEEARQKGYVTTLLNRRRYIPDIKSKSVNIRLFAERTAINTPIQGSAADMIKLAMIRIFERLKEENLETKMILQVHDELIFEVPEKELEKLEALVKSEMESAMTLNIPIKVDINIGDNWLDAK